MFSTVLNLHYIYNSARTRATINKISLLKLYISEYTSCQKINSFMVATMVQSELSKTLDEIICTTTTAIQYFQLQVRPIRVFAQC